MARVGRKPAAVIPSVVGVIGNLAPTKVNANRARHVIQVSPSARNCKPAAMTNANGSQIVAKLDRRPVPRQGQRKWKAAVTVEREHGSAPTAAVGPNGPNAKMKGSARLMTKMPKHVMEAVRFGCGGATTNANGMNSASAAPTANAARGNQKIVTAAFVGHKHAVAQTTALGVIGPTAPVVGSVHRVMYRSKRVDRALVNAYPGLKHAHAMRNANGMISGHVAMP